MPADTLQDRPPSPTATGRDELNLIDFPIATLQHQQPVAADGKRLDELVCVVNSYDADLQKTVPRKLTRRTSSKHGFPTPLEDEVLIALLSLTRLKNDFTAPRVSFRHAELFELMGWPANGSSNRRLQIALDRLTGLTLKYENSWTTESGAFKKEFTTGILESYSFTRQTRGRKDPDAERSWIQWASEVFADIQRGNVKELDTSKFYSLKLPVSRRMYRFLDRQLSTTPHFEIELTTFASHLGVSELKHVGKIKERLAAGLRELETLDGFLEPCENSERYRKHGPGQWLIVFDRASSGTATPLGTLTNTSRQVDHQPDAEMGLVREFYRLWNGNHEHTPNRRELTQAQELIERLGTERVPELLPLVIRRMKTDFPQARAFGATLHFWPEANSDYEKQQHRKQQEATSRKQEQAVEAEQAVESVKRTRLQQEWEALPEDQQQSLRQTAYERGSDTLRSFIDREKFDDPLVRLACYQELERFRLDNSVTSTSQTHA
ncbi:MAG: replication initiator protein A [Rhodopirellula sp.]|nr:replication initiator protein A [Rhodopirellula sp.]